MMQSKFSNSKAQMSIQFIFLLFIATIATMVIVAFLTSTSLDLRRYMAGIMKQDNEPIINVQRINLTTCGKVNDEIVKYGRMCYKKANDGLVSGEICYGIVMPQDGCAIGSNTISQELDSNKVNHSISIPQGSNRNTVMISFNYQKSIINID